MHALISYDAYQLKVKEVSQDLLGARYEALPIVVCNSVAA